MKQGSRRRLIIRFTNDSGELMGVFNADLDQSGTSQALWEMLPLSYRLAYWGDSLWIQVPLQDDRVLGKVTTNLARGDIAYWPPGKQIHLYYGRTPESKENLTPVPPTPVLRLGSIIEEPESLKRFLKRIPLRSSYITLDRADDKKV